MIENLILNGDFSAWTGGTSVGNLEWLPENTVTPTAFADHWGLAGIDFAEGPTQIDLQRVAFPDATLGEPPIPGGDFYYLHVDASAGNTGPVDADPTWLALYQKIGANYNRTMLAGRHLDISFFYRCWFPGMAIAAAVHPDTLVGGVAGPAIAPAGWRGGQAIGLRNMPDSPWDFFRMSVTVPSIITDYYRLYIYLQSGATRAALYNGRSVSANGLGGWALDLAHVTVTMGDRGRGYSLHEEARGPSVVVT